MRRRLCMVAGWVVVLGTVSALGGERGLTPEEVAILGRASTIYVDSVSTTWLPRGHSLSDVAPVIRARLVAAGFTVVRKEADPHDLIMRVRYREERGREFRFNDYGTDITCDLALEHSSIGSVLGLTLKASSSEQQTGTAPYLDALFQLDTNPYYFFIGDIVKERVAGGQDEVAGLISGVLRIISAEAASGDPARGTHSMPPSETVYAPAVLGNAAQELGRRGDMRAVPSLTGLLKHSEAKVRIRALEALGALRATQARPEIETVARKDRDRDVRQVASTVLSRLDGAGTKP